MEIKVRFLFSVLRFYFYFKQSWLYLHARGFLGKRCQSAFFFLFRVCQGRSAVTSVSLSIHPRRCKNHRPVQSDSFDSFALFQRERACGDSASYVFGWVVSHVGDLSKRLSVPALCQHLFDKKAFFSLPSQYALQRTLRFFFFPNGLNGKMVTLSLRHD